MKKIIALAILMLTGCATSGFERRLSALEEENRFLRSQNARRAKPAPPEAAPAPGAPLDPYAAPAPKGQTVTQTVGQGVVSDTVSPEPIGYHCFLYTKPTYGSFFIMIGNGQSMYAISPEIDGRRVIVERPAATASGYGAQPIGPQAITVLYPGEYCYVPVEYSTDPNGDERNYRISAVPYAKSHTSNGYVTVLNARPAGKTAVLVTPLADSIPVTEVTFKSYAF